MWRHAFYYVILAKGCGASQCLPVSAAPPAPCTSCLRGTQSGVATSSDSGEGADPTPQGRLGGSSSVHPSIVGQPACGIVCGGAPKGFPRIPSFKAACPASCKPTLCPPHKATIPQHQMPAAFGPPALTAGSSALPVSYGTRRAVPCREASELKGLPVPCQPCAGTAAAVAASMDARGAATYLYWYWYT